MPNRRGAEWRNCNAQALRTRCCRVGNRPCIALEPFVSTLFAVRSIFRWDSRAGYAGRRLRPARRVRNPDESLCDRRRSHRSCWGGRRASGGHCRNSREGASEEAQAKGIDPRPLRFRAHPCSDQVRFHGAHNSHGSVFSAFRAGPPRRRSPRGVPFASVEPGVCRRLRRRYVTVVTDCRLLSNETLRQPHILHGAARGDFVVPTGMRDCRHRELGEWRLWVPVPVAQAESRDLRGSDVRWAFAIPLASSLGSLGALCAGRMHRSLRLSA